MQGSTGERWVPPIVRTVATKNQGTDELGQRLSEHRAWLSDTDAGKARHAERARLALLAFLRDTLTEAALASLGTLVDEIAARVEARELDPYTACDRLIDRFKAR